MKRALRLVLVPLVLATVMPATQGAAIGPRAPPAPWKDPSGPPTEPDVWLKRLVGRFRFEGMIHVPSIGDCGELPPENPEEPPPPFVPGCQSVTGIGDCVAVGASPGVQCVLNLSWPDLYDVDFEAGSVSSVPGAVAYLDPSMALFGLDPREGAIRYLLVDKKGLPEGGLGKVNGHFATFMTECVNEPVGCVRVMRFEAQPERNIIFMRIDVLRGLGQTLTTSSAEEPASSIVLSMRRVAEGQPLQPQRSRSR